MPRYAVDLALVLHSTPAMPAAHVSRQALGARLENLPISLMPGFSGQRSSDQLARML